MYPKSLILGINVYLSIGTLVWEVPQLNKPLFEDHKHFPKLNLAFLFRIEKKDNFVKKKGH